MAKPDRDPLSGLPISVCQKSPTGDYCDWELLPEPERIMAQSLGATATHVCNACDTIVVAKPSAG